MTFLHKSQGPMEMMPKLVMIVVSILAIRRTFNYLRIFSVFRPIITMLTNVVWELRIFFSFYFIMTLLFSLMYGVVGIGN